MVRIDIRYDGQLRCTARHAPSGSTLFTDAPLDNHGKGASFSPTDLLATSLGACMATIMGIVAERHDIDLTGMTLSVEKGMVAEPVRRVGSLAVEIRIPIDPGPRQQTLLQNAAAACPVHASLHPDVARPVTFHWGA